jgi:hypothetical protein
VPFGTRDRGGDGGPENCSDPALARRWMQSHQAHQPPHIYPATSGQPEAPPIGRATLITETNREAALSGPAISEEEHEVTLHAERPVAEKEAVPVERVRLGKERVTGEQTVSGDIRKEHIETEGDTGTPR